jgi:hypothetical protein
MTFKVTYVNLEPASEDAARLAQFPLRVGDQVAVTFDSSSMQVLRVREVKYSAQCRRKTGSHECNCRSKFLVFRECDTCDDFETRPTNGQVPVTGKLFVALTPVFDLIHAGGNHQSLQLSANSQVLVLRRPGHLKALRLHCATGVFDQISTAPIPSDQATANADAARTCHEARAGEPTGTAKVQSGECPAIPMLTASVRIHRP